MATTNFNNRLITPELTEALSSYPLYSQDAKKKDAMCIAVFYLGNIRWYIMEGQQEGNDFTLYGIVAGLQETEYGYQSATEMASITYDASEYGLGQGFQALQTCRHQGRGTATFPFTAL